MKKNKKNLKGMTLIEMIISIAVFGIMGGLLILVGSNIDSTSRAANTLKTKVSDESPYAANHITQAKINGVDTTLPHSEVQIEVSINGNGEYFKLKDPDHPELGDEKKTYNNPSETIVADKYNTEDVYTDGMTAEQINAMRSRANGGLNFQFIEMQTATTTTTGVGGITTTTTTTTI